MCRVLSKTCLRFLVSPIKPYLRIIPNSHRQIEICTEDAFNNIIIYWSHQQKYAIYFILFSSFNTVNRKNDQYNPCCSVAFSAGNEKNKVQRKGILTEMRLCFIEG